MELFTTNISKDILTRFEQTCNFIVVSQFSIWEVSLITIDIYEYDYRRILIFHRQRHFPKIVPFPAWKEIKQKLAIVEACGKLMWGASTILIWFPHVLKIAKCNLFFSLILLFGSASVAERRKSSILEGFRTLDLPKLKFPVLNVGNLLWLFLASTVFSPFMLCYFQNH